MNCQTTQIASYWCYGNPDGMRAEKIEDISLSWVENPNADDGSGFYDPIYTTNKPTTRYWYDGQMAIEEDFMETSEQTRDPYVMKYGIGARGIDYIEKSVDGGSPTKVFPVYDGHGNMFGTLSRSGSNSYSIGDERYYDAWGDVNTSYATGMPWQRYCANLGHVQDDESDLIYMRARYYEPSTGRFVSEYPARAGKNWYAYCNNDSVNLSDESGQDPIREQQKLMLRTEWRFFLRMSLEFRPVAQAFVILWASWLAADIVYDVWDKNLFREIEMIRYVALLEQDILSFVGKPAENKSIRDRMKYFYEGYAIAIEISILIIGGSWDYLD